MPGARLRKPPASRARPGALPSTRTVNARDRIGSGPWYNAVGALIAKDVADLHGDASGISKQAALDETGKQVNGRGDDPNRHDMLTGSKPDGTAAEQTCNDWTSGGEGAAMLGHHDRRGLDDSAAAKSWNSSHPSRGCDLPALEGHRRRRSVLLLRGRLGRWRPDERRTDDRRQPAASAGDPVPALPGATCRNSRGSHQSDHSANSRLTHASFPKVSHAQIFSIESM